MDDIFKMHTIIDDDFREFVIDRCRESEVDANAVLGHIERLVRRRYRDAIVLHPGSEDASPLYMLPTSEFVVFFVIDLMFIKVCGLGPPPRLTEGEKWIGQAIVVQSPRPKTSMH